MGPAFLEGATAQDDAKISTYDFVKFYKNYIEKILIRSEERTRIQEIYSAIHQAVADPGFSWGGAPTPKVGVLMMLLVDGTIHGEGYIIPIVIVCKLCKWFTL